MFKNLNVFYRERWGMSKGIFRRWFFSAPFGATGRAVTRVLHYLRSALPLLPQPPRAFECIQVDC